MHCRFPASSSFRRAALVGAALLAPSISSSAQTFSPSGRITRENLVSPQPPGQSLAQSQTQSWGLLFKTQVERCWEKPVGSRREQFVETVFAVKLKRNGMIEDVRLVSISANTRYAQAYAESGLRALRNCQPYQLPESYYEKWRRFESVFTERYRVMSQR